MHVMETNDLYVQTWRAWQRGRTPGVHKTGHACRQKNCHMLRIHHLVDTYRLYATTRL